MSIELNGMKANPALGNIGGWQERHNEAVGRPRYGTTESLIVEMIRNWAMYARIHNQRYESLVGDDGFLGERWEEMGKALRAFLNGDCGDRLDMGTLDGYIMRTMTNNGIDTSQF